MSSRKDAEELFATSTPIFYEELQAELNYYHRTKIITMLDTYRIRKIMFPYLQVWLASKGKSFDSLLNKHESILLQALQEESSLSDATQMANENKYVLRGCFKTFLNTLSNTT